MADQELSIVTPSIAKSSTIATIGKSWGSVGQTGAASFELPIPLSAGRGYAPQMSLGYSSQDGNGPFGFGWSLGVSQISRRTDKGVPRYTEHDEIVGADGEVWMPELEADRSIKSRLESTYDGVVIGPHNVVRYWPKVESDFALHELWQPTTGQAPFWLVHGSDGSLLIYGKTPASRRASADPDNPLRISAWLLCESMNPHGEHIAYVYKADDQSPDSVIDYGIQRYLERVCYGNFTASKDLYAWTVDNLADLDWHFQLLFDYGERTTSLTEVPAYDGATLQPWPVRADPFSTYGQGFEVRTRRLCRQMLMFHHFPPSQGDQPVLVRRLLLEHSDATPHWPLSQISAAHYQAFDASGMVENTPPVEFEYSAFEINQIPTRLFETDHQPGIEDGRFYQCVDLYGEGVPGFLFRYDKCWYYREPLRAEAGGDAIGYGPWTALDLIPVADRNRPVQQLLTDLTGDGRLDWVTAEPGRAGFRTLEATGKFANYLTFNAFPLEFFHTLSTLGDLSGDGLNSIAMIGPKSVRLYANRREQGFATAEEVAHEPANDRLPLFSNTATELVLLGNLLGSDMPELCRIRHNEIRCWPNLGHGRFGEGRKISDLPFAYEQFDSSRVRLADLDGSGASALIYLKSDVFEIYLNRGGNGLEQTPISVPWPEGVRYDRLCQVNFADLQGLGCASLILTVTHMKPQHWRYDFVAAKPYLLTASNNNMGCSTSVVYRSSAQEWLDEKQQLIALKRPAVSHLPFPVTVVKKQQQRDEITGNCLTQSFTWCEGVYDSNARKFGGFGCLKQTDSESATGDDAVGFSQPVQVRTYFLSALSMDRSRDFYFDGDKEAVALGKTLFSLSPADGEFDQPIEPHNDDTRYQIARALAGSVARVETYALADVDKPGAIPYAVQELRYLVREIRRKDQYASAVLLPMTLETINYQYDRFMNDPLCSHEVNLRCNEFGSPTQALQVSYARRLAATDTPPFIDPDEQQWWRDAHDEAQQSFYLSETRAQTINLTTDFQKWRLGLPYLQRGNALVLPKGTLPTGLTPAQVSFEQLALHQDSSHWNTARLLTNQSVQRYMSTDGAALADGVAEFEALAGPLELAQLDKTALDAYSVLPPPFNIHTELMKIGYTPMPFLFEAPSPFDAEPALYSAHFGFAEYAGLDKFYKVRSYRETPSHGHTKAQYDDYNLAITSVVLPDGCTTRIVYDYHALQPQKIIDANENTQEAIYEPSGQPLATSFYGTENGEWAGFCPLSEYKRPEDLRPDLAIADPEGAVQKAASTLRKDLFSWMGQIPLSDSSSSEWIASGYLLPSGHIRASARQRLARRSTLTAAEQALLEAITSAWREPVHSVVLSADRYPYDEVKAQIQIIKACVDGFGRALQTQQLVDPGMAYKVVDGALVIEDGKYVEVYADPRWRISARVEYNNKGLAVREYRPLFVDTHGYVNDESLHELGYFDQLCYDPLGRMIKLINAKGDFSCKIYHPWYQTSLDFNDTAEAAPDNGRLR